MRGNTESFAGIKTRPSPIQGQPFADREEDFLQYILLQFLFHFFFVLIIK